MRGSIIKRSKTSWSLVVDQERDATGKRKQKWVTFVPRGVSQRDAMKAAEAQLATLLHSLSAGVYVDASTTTFVDYLRNGHSKVVVPTRQPETARSYRSFIDTHIAPAAIGAVPLAKLRTSDIEALYASVTLAPASWAHVNLTEGTLTIAQQLAPRSSTRPVFGPTKTGTSHTVTLTADTIARCGHTAKHSAN